MLNQLNKHIICRDDPGFTLIELLITMLIMVIALFALSALKNQSLKSTIAAQRITEATACAEHVIEEYIQQGYNLAVSDSGNCIGNAMTWDATVSSNIDNLVLKKITVQVENVTLKTLLTK